MLENALVHVTSKRKIAYKTLVSAGLITLAVLLPQLVHIILGQPGGATWLPMYLPVLIGGCLLGAKWGLAVGLFSPVVSFILTTYLENPMPAAPRLPFMILELAVFAVISGLFTSKIWEHGLWAFVAVISAQLCGRAAFLVLVTVFQSLVPFTPATIWQQIKTGFPGLIVQILLVPVLIISLRELLRRERNHD